MIEIILLSRKKTGVADFFYKNKVYKNISGFRGPKDKNILNVINLARRAAKTSFFRALEKFKLT